MRKSFDSLILLIQDTYQLDPYSKSVFLFCGRNTSKLKALYHDRDGWVLMHKRLDGEGRFQWPRSPSEARLITRQRSDGSWKGCPWTSQKQSGQPERKKISDICAKQRT